MAFWDLLTGGGNPTRQWPRSDDPLPTIRLRPFRFGVVRLGEGVESVRFLGRPDAFVGKFKCGNFTLTYFSRGLEVRFEEHRLAWLAFVLAGDTFWAFDGGPSPARLRFENGTRIDERSTPSDVKRQFGEPDEVEDDSDQTTFSYRDGAERLEFEFNDSGVLGAFVALLDR